MDYVIYTFGGGDLLWHVFNGIGRVFASNSEYFTPVGHLALTIGGIWAATRAIFRGNIGIFAMEWFFSSIFIFTLLFAPKATVWLKDEVSMNAPVKVDNIPCRFEAGTPNTTGIAGLLGGLKYIEKIGVKNIRKHLRYYVISLNIVSINNSLFIAHMSVNAILG